jgi:hypothetical protein
LGASDREVEGGAARVAGGDEFVVCELAAPGIQGGIMKARIQELSLPGSMLARGFWLYVWEVTTEPGERWLYIGRTGDSSSCNAQSPFARLSQHLGTNQNSNSLRKNLKKAGIETDRCRSFRLTAYGPVLREERTKEKHDRSRDIVAGLERELRDALHDAGYQVLNEVHSHKDVNESERRRVLRAFAKEFPRLASRNTRSASFKRRNSRTGR